MWRLPLPALLYPLLALAQLATRPRVTLQIEPGQLAPGGGALHVQLSTEPGAGEAVWIGLGFGTLVQLPGLPDAAQSARCYCVAVPPLAQMFSPPPRPGDQLLLVVYQGRRPLTGPSALPVGRGPAVSTHPRCPATPATSLHHAARGDSL